MSEYVSNQSLDAVIDRLKRASKVFLTTHGKPDGDAIGSVAALMSVLRSQGKTVEARVVPPVAESLLMVADGGLIREFRDGDSIDDADVYVIVDTGAWSQLGPLRQVLEPRLDRTLIIDHHLMGDVEAAYRWIDSDAAACCEVLEPIIDGLLDEGDDQKGDGNVKGAGALPPDVADALYMGIASDTGWFRFSNTRAQTLRLAARLIENGVDHARLYRLLEQMERTEKLQLMIRALGSLELVADERAAIMTLTLEDFEQTGARTEETERFVDVPQVVGSIEVVAMLTEMAAENGSPAQVRVSFRSKPGADAVNVADLAGRFGGGGHARAAGARIEASVEEARRQVRAAIAALYGG